MDIRDVFTQFFAQDSLLILAFLLIAFLLGLLAGYSLRGRMVRQLRKAVADKDQRIQALEAELLQVREELTLQEADLKKGKFALDEALAAQIRLEEERDRLVLETHSLRQELGKLRETADTYAETIEDLNDQILGLKARNAHLLEQVPPTTTDDALDITQSGSPLSNSPNYAEVSESRLAAVESRLQQLADENAQLRQEVGSLKLLATSPDQSTTDNGNEEEVLDIATDRGADIFQQDRQNLQQGDRDDLTLIDGLGPFLEKKLNDIGVATFAEIAGWDSARVGEVTRAINYFEGRIEKDNWVGQAKALLEQKNSGALSAPVTDTAVPTADGEGDDLKVIEGIGPKLESILKKAGILTFADLAKADPDDVQAILLAADPRYHMHDPGTWPAQARLALNEEWEILKAYQEQLHGGRHPED
ncbi:MAG: hypothetical protein H6555_11645 [Lewinellaceae bacterium]|nr:hypothetical protein [Lewinellaceae bacterium]